jgi:hypothetical protein
MLDEIRNDIKERMSGQPNSMAASADEVRICWLIAEVERLQRIITELEEPSVDASELLKEALKWWDEEAKFLTESVGDEEWDNVFDGDPGWAHKARHVLNR